MSLEPTVIDPPTVVDEAQMLLDLESSIEKGKALVELLRGLINPENIIGGLNLHGIEYNPSRTTIGEHVDVAMQNAFLLREEMGRLKQLHDAAVAGVCLLPSDTLPSALERQRLLLSQRQAAPPPLPLTLTEQNLNRPSRASVSKEVNKKIDQVNYILRHCLKLITILEATDQPNFPVLKQSIMLEILYFNAQGAKFGSMDEFEEGTGPGRDKSKDPDAVFDVVYKKRSDTGLCIHTKDSDCSETGVPLRSAMENPQLTGNEQQEPIFAQIEPNAPIPVEVDDAANGCIAMTEPQAECSSGKQEVEPPGNDAEAIGDQCLPLKCLPSEIIAQKQEAVEAGAESEKCRCLDIFAAGTDVASICESVGVIPDEVKGTRDAAGETENTVVLDNSSQTETVILNSPEVADVEQGAMEENGQEFPVPSDQVTNDGEAETGIAGNDAREEEPTKGEEERNAQVLDIDDAQGFDSVATADDADVGAEEATYLDKSETNKIEATQNSENGDGTGEMENEIDVIEIQGNETDAGIGTAGDENSENQEINVTGISDDGSEQAKDKAADGVTADTISNDTGIGATILVSGIGPSAAGEGQQQVLLASDAQISEIAHGDSVGIFSDQLNTFGGLISGQISVLDAPVHTTVLGTALVVGAICGYSAVRAGSGQASPAVEELTTTLCNCSTPAYDPCDFFLRN